MHTFPLRQHSPSPLISLKTKYNVGTGEHTVIGFGGVDWQPVWESSTVWFDPNTELREAFARAGKEFPEDDGEADRLYDAFDEFRAGDSVQSHLDEFDAEARRFADDCVGLVTNMVGERLSVGKLDERYAEVTGLMNDALANRADEFVATLDAEGRRMDTAKFLAAGVSRILTVDANLDEGKLTEALTECIVKRIGTPVHLGVGSALVQRYRADGHGQLANVVTAEDDGVLTIDREARWYEPGGRTVPMSRPLRVHRDLISPPPFGDPSSGDGEFYFTSTPSEVHARGGGIDLREAARTDREFARDDVEEIAKDRLGDVSDAVVAALDGEADRVVREAMAHSPANGSVPVRFIIAGHSGKPVGCKLTDIELPHATATVSSRQGARSARINVYIRGGWEFIKNP